MSGHRVRVHGNVQDGVGNTDLAYVVEEGAPFEIQHAYLRHAHLAGRGIRSIALAALDLLLSYRWPGNILEMDCVMAEVVRGGSGPEIGAASAARLDARAFADSALSASRFAGESLQQGLHRLDRLLGTGTVAVNADWPYRSSSDVSMA
jgi:hypothetical protein